MADGKKTKYIALISGKGGVGKTVCSINIASALSEFYRDVILIDGNFMNPNVSMYLGYPFIDVTLNDALDGRKSIRECVYLYDRSLKLIFSKIDEHDINYKRFHDVMLDLDGRCELVMIDAGHFKHCNEVILTVDDVIVVTSADLPAVVDTLKTVHHVKQMGVNVAGIIINRYHNDKFEMRIHDIEIMLETPVLAIIPEDLKIRESLTRKEPVVYLYPEGRSTVEFKKLAAKLIGQQYVHNIHKEEKFSFIHSFIRRTGLK